MSWAFKDGEWEGYCDCPLFESCECDAPFDWDGFASKVDYAFEMAQWHIHSAIVEGTKQYGHTRWELLTPPPKGLNVREESEWQDAAYILQSAHPVRTFPQLSTIRLELGEQQWIVTGYMLRVDEHGAQHLTSVLASEPPEFGWWMPSLKEFW